MFATYGIPLVGGGRKSVTGKYSVEETRQFANKLKFHLTLQVKELSIQENKMALFVSGTNKLQRDVSYWS